MSWLRISLIVGAATLLFGGVAAFYFFNSPSKTLQSETSAPVVLPEEKIEKEVHEVCFKPKTFVMTPEKVMGDYLKGMEETFQQAKEQGASEAEIQKMKSYLTTQVAGTIAIKESLDQIYENQPDFFQVSTKQDPGKSLKVKRVELKKDGFITVGPPLIGSPDDSKPIAVRFLQAGVHDNLTVPLNRYMDKFEAYVELHEDNGNKIFDGRDQDKIVTYRQKGRTDNYSFDDLAMIKVHFKTDTSANQYQSVYLNGPTKWEGLGTFDQVPGNLVNMYVARSNVPAWVVVHESHNGCVGKVLGAHSLLEDPLIARAKKTELTLQSLKKYTRVSIYKMVILIFHFLEK